MMKPSVRHYIVLTLWIIGGVLNTINTMLAIVTDDYAKATFYLISTVILFGAAYYEYKEKFV